MSESLFPKHANSPPPTALAAPPRGEEGCPSGEVAKTAQNAPEASQRVATKPVDNGTGWMVDLAAAVEVDWKAEAERWKTQRNIEVERAESFVRQADELRAELGEVRAREQAAKNLRLYADTAAMAADVEIDSLRAEVERLKGEAHTLHRAAWNARATLTDAIDDTFCEPKLAPATFTEHEVAQDGAAKGEEIRAAHADRVARALAPVSLNHPPCAGCDSPDCNAEAQVAAKTEKPRSVCLSHTQDWLNPTLTRLCTVIGPHKEHSDGVMVWTDTHVADLKVRLDKKGRVDSVEVMDPKEAEICELLRLLRTVASDSRFKDLDCCDTIAGELSRRGV